VVQRAVKDSLTNSLLLWVVKSQKTHRFRRTGISCGLLAVASGHLGFVALHLNMAKHPGGVCSFPARHLTCADHGRANRLTQWVGRLLHFPQVVQPGRLAFLLRRSCMDGDMDVQVNSRVDCYSYIKDS
jgi:hypothetical protein